MQTFKLGLGLDLRAVVPDSVLNNARLEAKNPDAPGYIRELNKQFPEGTEHNDDQFMLGILIAHLRGSVRAYIRVDLETKGIGGKLSPIKAVRTVEVPDEDDARLIRPLPVPSTNEHKAKAVLLRAPGVH